MPARPLPLPTEGAVRTTAVLSCSPGERSDTMGHMTESTAVRHLERQGATELDSEERQCGHHKAKTRSQEEQWCMSDQDAHGTSAQDARNLYHSCTH